MIKNCLWHLLTLQEQPGMRRAMPNTLILQILYQPAQQHGTGFSLLNSDFLAARCCSFKNVGELATAKQSVSGLQIVLGSLGWTVATLTYNIRQLQASAKMNYLMKGVSNSRCSMLLEPE